VLDERIRAKTEAVFPTSMVQSPLTDSEFLKGLLDRISEGVFVIDRERRFMYCNEASFRLTGYKLEEIAGLSCQAQEVCPISHLGHRACPEHCHLAGCIQDGVTREMTALLRHKEGRQIPVAISIQPIRASDGSIIGAVEFVRDDSARSEERRKSAAMERLALIDSLTRLPNRRLLETYLHGAMHTLRVTGAAFGVLMMDLDNLKYINDAFGHVEGDNALRRTAKTLGAAFRPTDTVGRWGGDEFVAIVANVDNATLNSLAERCVARVAQDSFYGDCDQAISLSISLGGTIARPRDSVKTLIKRADDLSYESKANGRNRATVR